MIVAALYNYYNTCPGMPGTLECARPRRLGDLSLAVLGRLCSRWGGDLEGYISLLYIILRNSYPRNAPLF